MKKLPCLLALLIPLSANARDFENWYFDFFKSTTTHYGNYFAPDRSKFASSKGTVTGQLSPDGTLFIETATIENSAAYINGWLRKLRDDHKLVVVAAAQAQRANDCLRGITWEGGGK